MRVNHFRPNMDSFLGVNLYADRLIHKYIRYLNNGSTKTYINADVAAELQLVGESQEVTVNVLTGRCETFKTRGSA